MYGYIFEYPNELQVLHNDFEYHDLEYPDELQELHNDYTLVPEKLEISCVCCQGIAAI